MIKEINSISLMVLPDRIDRLKDAVDKIGWDNFIEWVIENQDRLFITEIIYETVK